MTANLAGKNWLKLSARVRKQWARLNDDSLDVFLGRLEVLANRVQPSQITSADEVERQVQEWQRLLEGSYAGESADADSRVDVEQHELSASSMAR